MWQAAEAYERAMRLEPNDQSLQDAHHKAQIAEQKQAASRKHKFHATSAVEARPAKKAAQMHSHARPSSGAKAGALSFADEEEEGEEQG